MSQRFTRHQGFVRHPARGQGASAKERPQEKYMFANIELRVTDEKKEREEKDYPNTSDPHLLNLIC